MTHRGELRECSNLVEFQCTEAAVALLRGMGIDIEMRLVDSTNAFAARGPMRDLSTIPEVQICAPQLDPETLVCLYESARATVRHHAQN